LGTLHTVGAAQAVDRIINAFPPHLQQQARLQLGNTLLGVTAQSLLPRSDNTGRVVVMEILVATMAVRNLIREGKSHQLISQMQTGAKYGMQTMEGAVLAAYRQGLLSREVVIEQGIEPEAL